MLLQAGYTRLHVFEPSVLLRSHPSRGVQVSAHVRGISPYTLLAFTRYTTCDATQYHDAGPLTHRHKGAVCNDDDTPYVDTFIQGLGPAGAADCST